MIRDIFKRNQRHKLEQELDKRIKQICRKCDIPYEEWCVDNILHIDENLYIALKKSKHLISVKSLMRQYDAMITKADLSKIKLNSKYYWIFKII